MVWEDVARDTDGVTSVAALVGLGVNRKVVAARVRAGRWQRALPGVVVTHGGPLSVAQRRRAALVYAGPAAVLSHRSAASAVGLRVPETDVEVTVPHGQTRPSVGFVVVHQSTRVGVGPRWAGLPCTPVARTVIDVACGMRRLDDVRALVSDAVQRRLTTVAEIGTAALQAPRHSPALLRRALAEVAAGARSVGECAFLALVTEAGLPVPELGARLHTWAGTFLLDALWRQYGVAVEIDGRSWHLDAVHWAQDLRRQNLITATGLVLLRFPVTRLRDDPAGVVAEVRAALDQAAAVSAPPPRLLGP